MIAVTYLLGVTSNAGFSTRTASRRNLFAGQVRHLGRRALLDGDAIAIRRIQVHGRNRRRHVKGDAMLLRQHGDRSMCRSCWRRRRWRRCGQRPRSRHRSCLAASSRPPCCRLSAWSESHLSSTPTLSDVTPAGTAVSRRRTHSAFCPTPSAARITPSAVPYPAVASAPALQWVKTAPLLGSSTAPCRPMASLAAMSSTSMRCASATSSALISSTGNDRNCSNLSRIRRIAQNRFTAVGRVPASTLQIASNSRSSSASVCA